MKVQPEIDSDQVDSNNNDEENVGTLLVKGPAVFKGYVLVYIDMLIISDQITTCYLNTHQVVCHIARCMYIGYSMLSSAVFAIQHVGTMQ